ncbi:MAG: phage holin family protein [Chloroflexi bacterium]|nr:phage holin family protein [Chloroflexota bacterium]
MRWLIRLLLSGLALYITSLILNDAFAHDLSHMVLSSHLELAAFAILCLSLVNSLVRPVVRLLAMPLTFMTLGLSGLIINAILFWAVGHFTGGYEVGGVVGLLLGPIIMGFVTGVLSLFIRDGKKA